MQLPKRVAATRYIHIHRNEPGMLGRLNSIFSEHRVNIVGQYLQTDGDLGYVVVETDTDRDCDEVLSDLRNMGGTIRTRLIRRV